MTSLLRVLRTGVVAAVAVGAAGWGAEQFRFGSSDVAAARRVERELRQRLDASAEALGAIAARAAAERDRIRIASRDQAEQRRLFEAMDAALPRAGADRTGVTVFDASGVPLAWAGRVSEFPKERIDGRDATFVAPGALGPRLVRITHLSDTIGRSTGQRLATVIAEQLLGRPEDAPALADTFGLATSLAPVTLRPWMRGSAASNEPFTFVIAGRDGTPLALADVVRGDLSAARAGRRRQTWALVLGVLGVTVLFCTGPAIARRRERHQPRAYLTATLGVASLLVAAFLLLSLAVRWAIPGVLWTSPPFLLLAALAAAVFVWLLLDLVEHRRSSRPRPRLRLIGDAGGISVGAAYFAAGVVATTLVGAYQDALKRLVAHTSLDVLHFSLHPMSATRLAVAFALVLLHAAVLWSAVAVLRAAGLLVRTPRTWIARGWIAGGALAGAGIAALLARVAAPSVPWSTLGAPLFAAALCAMALGRLSGRIRRISQTQRLGVFFLALLAPALAMYPSLFADARSAKELLVASVYGPQAASQREDLQRRLQQAVDQIDALPSLAEFVVGGDVSTPTTDRAFLVWSRTDLAAYRLTSAVELYRADGRLVSRFALLPEYATGTYRAATCTWEQPVDEGSTLGSSERHVLRTGRGICEGGRIVGSVLVRVILDYQTLPFISSQSPYLESLRSNREAPPEGISGRDVEFVVYGWSRAPIFESGPTVWTLSDGVFDRLVEARAPFWADVDRGGQTFRVYFQSDRGGIYALGYPVLTWLGLSINLTELVLLVGALYAALLAGGWIYRAVSPPGPVSGRTLLHEIRSSFYRKLSLTFVAGAIVPVVVLAFATRTYFINQLLASAEDTAVKTVTTAQRLVEDYATLQQRGPGALGAIDDQIMVLVRRAIDEDVSLFDRQRLQATSVRPLFAEGLLSTRTPPEVFRTLLLERRPTFVGEERVGTNPYRLAAATVRAGGREAIVAVPLTNRQREIEQQIDELDRQVLFAIVLFSLLGAALGYWLAERIADPVNRLTRATRRIARGDLDARIAATSSDELRRLVDDFNQMAADLKRQRAELEHTQRLQAWADMARQVAHDIKNPLTPIQLSAEHARRVNLDRGRPLSPVLDDCVNAILTQVKLLRQISAEFSSFASSPTPRPEVTSLPVIIDEVVEPYRTGLSGRIAMHVSAPADLPAVLVDRTLFARALTNVIENALHAMPGTGTLTISSHQPPATGLPATSHLVVEVTDTGVGMDQDALNRIFEPYFSTRTTGTGLGLTIAKRNVELNGGTIEVRSTRGVGTTVTMTVPIESLKSQV
ncbi:MAG: HAMP domain-containing histidine kinase [Acidobacteria bacterium]|nr:HAMP domain-containing histidine kinase [Acidobacteriota bacterium]